PEAGPKKDARPSRFVVATARPQPVKYPMLISPPLARILAVSRLRIDAPTSARAVGAGRTGRSVQAAGSDSIGRCTPSGGPHYLRLAAGPGRAGDHFSVRSRPAQRGARPSGGRFDNQERGRPMKLSLVVMTAGNKMEGKALDIKLAQFLV